MSVIRIHKTKNFTVMSNTHLFDKNLTLKAVGLLSKLLALPDDWSHSIKGLCAMCKENETAVKNALNELRDNRYVIVERIEPSKETKGRIQYEYFVYEQPQGEDNKKIDVKEAYRAKQEQGKQSQEIQGIENLGVDGLGVDNQGDILNTNIPSTDISNTDLQNTKVLSTDNNSFSNEKDNSKDKSLEFYNSPVQEQGTTRSANNNSDSPDRKIITTIGRKKHKNRENVLKDMPTRAAEIARKIIWDDDEIPGKMYDCVKYFVKKYENRFGQRHPDLTNASLEKAVNTMLSTITDEARGKDGNFYDNEYTPLVSDITDREDFKAVIDKYFDTNFKKNVDYRLSHFADEQILMRIMNKCELHGDKWYESREPY